MKPTFERFLNPLSNGLKTFCDFLIYSEFDEESYVYSPFDPPLSKGLYIRMNLLFMDPINNGLYVLLFLGIPLPRNKG